MNRNAETSVQALVENRNEIDAVDTELLRLINIRAGIALRLAAIKKVLEWNVYDPDRERLVVERACAESCGPMDESSVANIFRSIIEECRRVQEISAYLPEMGGNSERHQY